MHYTLIGFCTCCLWLRHFVGFGCFTKEGSSTTRGGAIGNWCLIRPNSSWSHIFDKVFAGLLSLWLLNNVTSRSTRFGLSEVCIKTLTKAFNGCAHFWFTSERWNRGVWQTCLRLRNHRLSSTVHCCFCIKWKLSLRYTLMKGLDLEVFPGLHLLSP